MNYQNAFRVLYLLNVFATGYIAQKQQYQQDSDRSARTPTNVNHYLRNLQGKFECTLLIKCTKFEDHSVLHEVECALNDDNLKIVAFAHVPPIVQDAFKNGTLVSGADILHSSSAMLADDGKLSIPVGAEVTIERLPEARRLQTSSFEGVRSVLALRAIAADTSSAYSESQLSDDIFGTNGDPVNLKERTFACSHGKLDYAPASSASNGAVVANGVHTVTISNNVNGAAQGTIFDAMKAQGDNDLGNLSQYDHVMICKFYFGFYKSFLHDWSQKFQVTIILYLYFVLTYNTSTFVIYVSFLQAFQLVLVVGWHTRMWVGIYLDTTELGAIDLHLKCTRLGTTLGLHTVENLDRSMGMDLAIWAMHFHKMTVLSCATTLYGITSLVGLLIDTLIYLLTIFIGLENCMELWTIKVQMRRTK